MRNFFAWLLRGIDVFAAAVKWGWDPENFRDGAPEGPDTTN